MATADVIQGRSILVIEDDYLVAEILVQMLEEAGSTVLGPIGWRDEALAFIRRNSPAFDTAVLDVNLHGQSSYPIADALIDRGIKFIFTTGYGADALDTAYRGYPRCEKPFQQQTLLAVLASVLT
jgi:DNA-binding NtrC family response regulator